MQATMQWNRSRDLRRCTCHQKLSRNEVDLPPDLQSEMEEIITEEYEDEDKPEGVAEVEAARVLLVTFGWSHL